MCRFSLHRVRTRTAVGVGNCTQAGSLPSRDTDTNRNRIHSRPCLVRGLQFDPGLHLRGLDLASVRSREPSDLRALVRLGQLRSCGAVELTPTVKCPIKCLRRVHGRLKNERVRIFHPDWGLATIGRQNLFQNSRHRIARARDKSRLRNYRQNLVLQREFIGVKV